jgi:dTDP-4-dehydrorhamnose 3,5-epimerase
VDVLSTAIPDVKIIRPTKFGDSRGFFVESWNRRSFAEAGLEVDFVLDNHSRSRRGTLRGLHCQIRHTQGKLVRVATGCVFDVAVDCRRSSPTFGKWVGTMLSDDDLDMLWIPPGFMHGFLVLSDTADVLYKCTDTYAPSYEQTVRWDDEDIGIDWPLTGGIELLLSAKDRAGIPFRDAQYFP